MVPLVDGSDKFRTNFFIRYQDVDPFLRATPATILGAMQEAAILHSEAAGKGIDWLSERNLSWMIVQTHIEILGFPAWRSRVEVTTWPSDIGRLLSRREFVLRDEKGSPLVLGTTLWAFMDTKARRVTRVPEVVSSAYPVLEERALDLPFRRPDPSEKMQWEERFPIRRWEIDFNGHVNNLKYLDWILEAMPAGTRREWVLRRLNIRYEKEVALGQNVLARSGPGPQQVNGDKSYGHEIRLEDSGESVASAVTVWAPRQTS
jgi:medium-chain acyl-[acyl-carrier-protein] hydrolase